MVSLDLCDTLHFAPADSAQGLSLRCSGLGADDIPTDERNLVVRAAQGLLDYANVNHGAQIRLHKRIPMEAGMGGGSSDAAATLVALNVLWDLKLSSEQLHQVAAQLGSDVNFFIDSPAAAICRGRGERVTSVPVNQRLHFVVRKPNSGLSTKHVFEELKIPAEPITMNSMVQALQSGRHAAIGGQLHNRLESVSRDLNLDVHHSLQQLNDQKPNASLMSGSGTACFALCRSRREAVRIAAKLCTTGGGGVFAVSTR